MSDTTILVLGCAVTMIAAYGAYLYCHDLFGGATQEEARARAAERPGTLAGEPPRHR